jgi:hypothetical protein
VFIIVEFSYWGSAETPRAGVESSPVPLSEFMGSEVECPEKTIIREIKRFARGGRKT